MIKKPMIKKYMILLVTCMMITMIVLASCGKKNKETEETTTAPTTAAPATTEASQETTVESTSEPEYISKEEAMKKIQDVIGDRGYYFEALEENKTIDKHVYYLFQVSDNSSIIEPGIIVDKVSGELLCYYKDGKTAPFSEFPLYTAPTNSNVTSSNEMTKEAALEKLSKLPAKTLGLKKSLSEYTLIEYDNWTTNVDNIECYGINVYEKTNGEKLNVGVFYVAIDGSKMYRYDSVDEIFIELK
jgi:hypothetical protein